MFSFFNNFYFLVAIKLLIGLLSLSFVINISGKGNLAPSNASDQIQNYVLGGIIGGTIYNSAITVLQYILILFLWCIVILGLKWIKTNNRFMGQLLDSQPLVLVNHGKLNIANCRRAGLSAHDLSFKLRAAGYYYVEDLQRVVVEQDGRLLIIPYGEENPKYPLVTDGQIQTDILEIIGKDDTWLTETLADMGYRDLSRIFLVEYRDGKLLVSAF
ncbi:MAG: DUF421 domain-containing protein [Stomatobaculum longum]|nr:DUF421 domain-containing protein [Stomatobaculum longum]